MTFTAGGDSYENVCIESVTFPKEESNSERIELKLKQVSINSTETANISIKYARGGTSKKNTGASRRAPPQQNLPAAENLLPAAVFFVLGQKP